jgi:predicted negative regulator of RcsB-dependent stress response
MEGYASEHEQVEALKKWGRENWKSVSAGAVIGLSVLLAVTVWRSHTRTQAEAASAEYQQLVGEVERNDTAALAHGARIVSQYGDTTYAVFASLAMARLEVDNGDNVAARKHLEWALQNADPENLQHVIRLRLARVMLSQAEAKAALDLVAAIKPGSFMAEYEELKGDSYLKLNQIESARTAYRNALSTFDPDDAKKQELLQMKLYDLGVESKVGQEKE